MKKLIRNKKGFSLAEVLLVIAIIAILSGATVVGVVSWLNNSQETATQLKANSENFEADAVKDVNEKKGFLPKYPQETEALETGKTGDDKTEGGDKTTGDDTSGGGITGGNDTSGGGNGNGNGNGEGGGNGNGEGGGNGGGEGGGNGGEGGGNGNGGDNGNGSTDPNTVTSSNTTTNATGSSVSVSGYWNGSNANMRFSVNQNVKEFTFWVPDEVVGGTISCDTGNCKYTYNGNYITVTMTYGSTTGSSFSINAPNGNKFDPSKIIMYSYVPGSV